MASRGYVPGMRPGDIAITDYRELIKELKKIDGELPKAMQRSFKHIGEPVRKGIREAIPSKPPLSGMRKKVIPGRVTWGTGKPARSALISAGRPKIKAGAFTIARIKVGSPGTIIADMAGASDRFTNSRRRTKPYKYSLSPTGERSHRITFAGSAKFKRNLTSRLGGKASRMVYPGAEKELPRARDRADETIDKYVNHVNREIERGNI